MNDKNTYGHRTKGKEKGQERERKILMKNEEEEEETGNEEENNTGTRER